MFETVDEAGLVASIEEATRAEAAAAALRSAAIGELVARRIGDAADDPRAWWICDVWDSTAAEIAAAMNISHRKASGQMRVAETLREHLPTVAALFASGRLSARVIGAITWRTRLITDEQVWAAMDCELARRVEQWGPLADEKLTAAVDALVQRLDPAAVIEARSRVRTRDFVVGDYEDEAGLTSVWGRLNAADAAVLDRRVAAIAATVCADDPRTRGQRRADAAAAWGNGNDYLSCGCGSPRCPAAGRSAPASAVVVHVVADQAAVTGGLGTAVLSGTEMLPTPVLAELLRNGAILRPLTTPCEQPESGYRPSAGLDRFVRARDLTCRFPGCAVPAEMCDIDHVVPFPIGPTHPSNLACLCRKHHLLKTFWTGDWSLTLAPDGAAKWTSPTGRTYTTQPGSRLWFPTWNTTTADLRLPRVTSLDTGRDTRMPLRSRTRAAARLTRIKCERALNNPDPPSF